MTKINLIEYKKNLEKLDLSLNNYKENSLNLFKQLKEVGTCWSDGNYLAFEEAIYLEKTETDLFFQTLIIRKNFLLYMYNKYENIGKKIEYNVENKTRVIDYINDSILKCKDVVSELRRVDRSFQYPERSRIYDQINKVESLLKKLEGIKSNVSNLVKKFSDIELDIINKTKELERMKINEFGFSLVKTESGYAIKGGSKGTEEKGIINKEELDKKIKVIEVYVKEEKQLLKEIRQSMQDCNIKYNAPLSKIIEEDQNYIFSAMDKVNEKRVVYEEILKNVKDLYETLGKETILTIEKNISGD